MATAYLSLFFAVATAAPTGLQVPDHPNAHVNDYAQVLAQEQTATLESRLQAYEQAGGVKPPQVAIAIFRALAGESLEDFSIRLAEKWKIGHQGSDNGVLITVFIDDHKLRIEVGYGLEGQLTDALCAQIIRENIGPYFKKGDYASGLTSGVDRIFSTLGIALPAGQERIDPPQPVPQSTGLDWLQLLLLFGAVGCFIFISIMRARRGYTASGSGWSSGGWGGGSSWGGGGFSGGGGSFGGGGSSGSW